MYRQQQIETIEKLSQATVTFHHSLITKQPLIILPVV